MLVTSAQGYFRDFACTLREDIACKLVEACEVAKARLNHGKQAFTVAGQKALRLGRIEGGKPLHHQPPRFRLVLVRMCNRVDLNPLVGAAN